ncbi:claspin-like [Watersipora subatra]|uniref:claspin-like n=1 Tax=Watersipora subatra TaxID=2589382 RepID=UPI00355C5672
MSDDEKKSAISDEENSAGSDEESEEEVVNKLSSKFSGPAAKKESKAARRTVKQDEKMKIYSEKQRMIREQQVSIPVYQPQKKSLREFLGEQAPQLLNSLRNQPKEKPLDSVPKRRHSEKPYRPPKRLEELNYLKSDSILYTPDKRSFKADVILETPPAEETDPILPSTQNKLEATLRSQLLPTPEEENEYLPNLLSEITKVDNQSNEKLTELDSQEQVKSPDDAREDDSQLTAERHGSQLSSVAAEDGSQIFSQYTNSQLKSQSSLEEQVAVSQSADNSQAPDNISSVKVIEKTSPMRRRIEAKKLKLRKLVGDTVDLEMVPQLTCDMDGVVILDNKTLEEKHHFKKFKTSFEKKAAKAQQLEDERKRQREKKALRVVKSLPDGSQHEISMDAYSNKTAEETGGVHKLAVLKQILKAKISEKRNEELKEKEATIKLEALEELPEDEILEDDYEFSDEEREECKDSDTEVGPVLGNSDTESRSSCQIEKDEALMRRVRAVLESDEEREEDVESSTQPSTYPPSRQTLTDCHISESLDRLLGDQPLATKTSSNTLNSERTSVDDTETKDIGDISKPVNPVDENAQDVNVGFTSGVDASNGVGKSLLGFTQGMFSTQQAEDELEGLCSGRFGTPQPYKDSQTHVPANDEQVESEAMTKVLASKKQALQFSDEEESDAEQTSERDDKTRDEEMDELDELEDESEEESEGEQISKEGVDDAYSAAVESNKSVRQALFLHKPRQTKRQKMMGEFLDEQAELSGDDAGSDEDLDFGAEADILELEKGDFDHMGNEEELRSQIAKAHAKHRFDDDAREVMLMKEMLLPDGDLHSDSTRQRKFRWRNVEYGTEAIQHTAGESDNSDGSDNEGEDSAVRELQEKLEKERAEREAWLKDQRDSKVQLELEESQPQFSDDSQSMARPPIQQQQHFTFDLTKKRKKPSYVLGKSQKYLERFKELHKNIKEEQRGPVSHKNLVFRPISKEDAESQQEMIWNKS